MKLEITKEKVLEAASKCSTAKATLQTLFPECFEHDIKISIGEKGFIINGKSAIYVEDGQYGVADIEFHLDSRFEWELAKSERGYQLKPKTK